MTISQDIVVTAPRVKSVLPESLLVFSTADLAQEVADTPSKRWLIPGIIRDLLDLSTVTSIDPAFDVHHRKIIMLVIQKIASMPLFRAAFENQRNLRCIFTSSGWTISVQSRR